MTKLTESSPFATNYPPFSIVTENVVTGFVSLKIKPANPMKTAKQLEIGGMEKLVRNVNGGPGRGRAWALDANIAMESRLPKFWFTIMVF